MTANDLYDYFTPLETAIATVFEAQEFVIWTPLRDPEFQKQRPRVEAVLMPGAALGYLLPATDVPVRCGFLREKARRANLILTLVTAPEITVHRAYVARTLFLLDTLGLAMNATDDMPYHAVQSVKCNGGSLSLNPESGAYETTLTCDVDFSVKEAAWAGLET